MENLEIKRTLFNQNAQKVEFPPLCAKSTYERWKAGELMFFVRTSSFANPRLNDERIEHIPDYLASKAGLTEEEAEEFRKEWESWDIVEKAKWYRNFIVTNFGAVSYEDFRKRDDVFHMEVEVKFGDVDAVCFYMMKPKTPIGMEI